MSLLDALLHLVNLFAAPVWTSLILVLLAKGWVWRQALRGVGWRRLWGESALLGCVGVLIALVVLGADGKLMGYALWLALASLPLGWRLARS
jgi:hypothetical protein